MLNKTTAIFHFAFTFVHDSDDLCLVLFMVVTSQISPGLSADNEFNKFKIVLKK